MNVENNANAAQDFMTAEEEAKHRKEQIASLFRGRLHWVILLASVLGTAAAVAAYFSQKPVYQAAGSVKVQPELDAVGTNPQDTLIRMFMPFMREQMAALTGYDVAQQAIESEVWRSALSTANRERVAPAGFIKSIDADIPTTGADYNIQVSFQDADPNVAAAGVNAALDAYVKRFREAQRRKLDGKLSIIRDRLSKLSMSDADLQNQIAIYVPEAEQQALKRNMDATDQEILEVRAELRNIDVELNFYKSPSNSQIDAMRDPRSLRIQDQINDLDKAIEALNYEGYGENHRDVKKLAADRRQLEKDLEELQLNLKSGTAGGVEDSLMASLERSKQQMEEKLAKLTAQQKDLASKAALIKRPLDQLDENNKLRLQFESDRIKERMRGQAEEQRVEITAYAQAPAKPYNDGKRLQLAVLGFLVGGAVGVGLVVVVGLLDSRLRHAADAVNGLRNARMLGVLPSLPDQLGDPEQAERAAHSVNHIRTLLQIAGRGVGREQRVFAITGPAAGSGKSSLTIALGLSYAASGKSVLLIDGDLVGAGMTRRLGAVSNVPFEQIVAEDGRVSSSDLDAARRQSIMTGTDMRAELVNMGALSEEEADRLARRHMDATVGILDVLEDPTRLKDCVGETGINNLAVLPVGNARPEDAGLLSPETKRALLEEARSHYDIVLIDTGPVLGSLEASMAAAEADATILIVSRGDSKSVASRSLEHLRSVGANVAGIVFNHAVDADMAEASYGSLVSQDRRPSGQATRIDPATATRFGPLGSAVATYGPGSRRLMKPAGANGSANGHLNGAARKADTSREPEAASTL